MQSEQYQDFIENIDNILNSFTQKEQELNRGIYKLEKQLTKSQLFNRWVKMLDLLLELRTAKKALLDLKNSEPIVLKEDIELQNQVQLYLNSILNDSASIDYVYYFPKFLQQEIRNDPFALENEPILRSIYIIHDYLKTQKASKEEELHEAMHQWTKQNPTASVKENVYILRKLKSQIYDYQNLKFDELINQLIQIHQLHSKQEAFIVLKKGIQLLTELHTLLAEKIAKEVETEVTAYRRIAAHLDRYIEDSKNNVT